MRHSNQRRSRPNRTNGKRQFNNGPNRSYESNGPSIKLRGTAAQVFDKYLALARDASSTGDRIAAENFFQHAEHYYRIHTAFIAERKAREVERNNEDGSSEDSAQESSRLNKNSQSLQTTKQVDSIEEASNEDSSVETKEPDKPKVRRRRSSVTNKGESRPDPDTTA